MAEMKNRKQIRYLGEAVDAGYPHAHRYGHDFEDELADSPIESVPYPTNAHSVDEFVNPSKLRPMWGPTMSITTSGNPVPYQAHDQGNMTERVREQVLNNVGSGHNGMTFRSEFKKEDR